MPRLLLKLSLLFVPVLAFYAFPVLVLARAGELRPIEAVIERQAATVAPVLYGVVYSNRAKDLKFEGVRHRKPRIIALGTSRVMQFRSATFRPEARFYNAGGGAETIFELRPFLERLPPRETPEFIILGLDQWLFNSESFEFRRARAATIDATGIIQAAKLRVYSDHRAGKFTLPHLFGSESGRSRIGLNAIVRGDGFRNDGSYYYGDYIADPHNPRHEDFEFRDTFRRIEAGVERMEYGSEASREAAEELDAFLDLCGKRGIRVAAFLPPYAHAVYERFTSLGDKYGYLSAIEPMIAPIFSRHGASLFDFSDLASVGATDLETLDGFHGSETAYLRILLKMMEGDARMLEYARPRTELLQRLSAAGPLVVFANEEF